MLSGPPFAPSSVSTGRNEFHELYFVYNKVNTGIRSTCKKCRCSKLADNNRARLRSAVITDIKTIMATETSNMKKTQKNASSLSIYHKKERQLSDTNQNKSSKITRNSFKYLRYLFCCSMMHCSFAILTKKGDNIRTYFSEFLVCY